MPPAASSPSSRSTSWRRRTEVQPEHDRVRRLVSKAFTVRRVEDFRPAIRGIAEELAADMALGDECDFVAAFADPFALRVLCRFVGIPEDVQAEVRDWTADVGLIFGFSVEEHRTRIEAALRNLDGFIDELLDARRQAPRDDLLSALIAAEEAGELLTDAELRSMVITLISAGHGTMQHQLGNAMSAFMAHPHSGGCWPLSPRWRLRQPTRWCATARRRCWACRVSSRPTSRSTA
jgi:cytochrome P450